MASSQNQCKVCNRYTNTVRKRKFPCPASCAIYACFQCANIPKCHEHEALMSGRANHEFNTDNECAFCEEEYAYDKTGNAEVYEKVTRLYNFFCHKARCNRYLCHTCATELACEHSYELKEAEKKKPKGTSNVLDE